MSAAVSETRLFVRQLVEKIEQPQLCVNQHMSQRAALGAGTRGRT